MNKKTFLLALFVVLASGVVSLTWQPSDPAVAASPSVSQQETNGACGDASSEIADTSDPQRVPPGCCTSNCNTTKDCDRICGPGNCVCIATNSCCRRCSW